MRKAATLIEIIFTIVIAAILSIGTANILQNVAMQAQKAKQLTTLALDTQSALDQIAEILYYRVPNSAIGYNADTNIFKPILTMDNNPNTLEWFGSFSEATKLDRLSSFVDMASSDRAASELVSPDSDFNWIDANIGSKFIGASLANMGLVFAGSFDTGVGASSPSFGWHGSSRSEIFDVGAGSSANRLQINGTQPNFIYEKFYLLDSAYGVTRSANVDKTATCITDLDIDDDDTLLLFSNYRPWNGETFCADKNGANKRGSVTILAESIVGFRIIPINRVLQISINAREKTRGSETFVNISKQKVIF